MGRYAVGIDFGTTNSCCAYVDLREHNKRIEFFAIPQLVDNGEIAERRLLPSFIYLPSRGEIESGAVALPWNSGAEYCVGEMARRRSIASPDRVVSSAKSWLCNPSIDRKAPILPWTRTEESGKISPFEAVSRVIGHIRDAWNYKNPLPEQRLEDQDIVLTVPASFDDFARELTVEAAERAGLRGVSLLEEPQSAFYFWLSCHESMWKRELRGIGSAIVCDVGGGTTDFTVIRVETTDSDASLKRSAVGDHLLLGGDNMDMGLALMVEREYVGSSGRLDPVTWASLGSECRFAKEALLDADAPESAPVTVLGRGSRLMSSAISARLEREACLSSVMEGFFPFSEFEPMRRTASSGLSEWGLPYQKDPRITAHLADFIKGHLKEGEFPDAVLFNGGVFKSDSLRNRVREQLERWAGRPVRVLENSDLDLAVAGGAAYFSLVRQGDGVRIGGGSPRSYYVKVDSGEPGTEGYLCLIPKDLMTETVQEMREPVFSLRLDFPVSFSIFSSNRREEDMSGDLVTDGESLSPLPPLFTVMEKKEGQDKREKSKDVFLKSKLTEIGTLELSCAACDGSGEWRLRFGVKSEPSGEPVCRTRAKRLAPAVAERVRDAVRKAFDKKSGASHETLLSDVEEILGMPRRDWEISVNRMIFDALLDVAPKRRIDSRSESSWFNAAGFTVRPGFGYPLDDWRMRQAEGLIVKWLQSNKEPKNRIEWHIFWRRCSGGLSGEAQRLLFDRVSSWILKGRRHIKPFSGPRPSQAETAEILTMLSFFDKIPVSLKKELGDHVMESVYRRDPAFACSLMRRIAGRVTIYGNANFIIPPESVVPWAERMMSGGSGHPALLGALSSMAALTGDRSRDVEEGIRERIIKYLKGAGADEGLVSPLIEIRPVEPYEEEVFLGESIPPGLALKRA